MAEQQPAKKTPKLKRARDRLKPESLKDEGVKHLNGFSSFIRTQGVVGLAVGLVIGGAVSVVVKSLIDNIVMPPLGFILGSADGLKGLTLNLGTTGGREAVLQYGTFLNDLINFLVIALTIYLVVHTLGLDKLDKRRRWEMQTQKTDEQWRKILTPEQFAVLREKATEAPFSGEYDGLFANGIYACAACGQVLFDSTTKFDANCGWPSFYDVKPGSVEFHKDSRFGMDRTEVTCSNCGSHLGHLFEGEGFETPTDKRYCINSLSLKFTPSPPVTPKQK